LHHSEMNNKFNNYNSRQFTIHVQ